MVLESDNTGPGQRIHFRAVSAIILAAVLGALAGWHGHKTLTGIAAVSVSIPEVVTELKVIAEPKVVGTTLPMQAQILEQPLHFRELARNEQLRSAEIQTSLDKIEAHRQK